MALAADPASIRRPIAHQHRHLPISPEWIPFELAIEHAPFWRFVFLSMLLHTLAILMFGAPSGGSREGRAMWGTLQAVLAPSPPVPAPTPASVLPPATPAAPIEAPSQAIPAVSPKPEIPEAPFAFPPLLDRLPAPDIKLDALPPLRVPPPTEVQVPPAAPIPAPLLQPLPSSPANAPLPSFERVPEIRVPAQAPPIPAPLLQPLPQPPERAVLPPLEREVLPPIERAPAIETPALPAERGRAQELAVPPKLPPAIERAPVAPDVAPKPVIPDAPSKPVIPDAPPKSVAPDAPSKPVVPDAPPKTVIPDAPAGATIRDPIDRAPPSPDSLFKRRDEPASTFDPTRPTLDPDALRKRAGELAREGTGQRALLPFPMPPLAKPKSKLESAIENARKPDCRDAYKALGLAAVVPLIANEFGEGSCRW